MKTKKNSTLRKPLNGANKSSSNGFHLNVIKKSKKFKEKVEKVEEIAVVFSPQEREDFLSLTKARASDDTIFANLKDEINSYLKSSDTTIPKSSSLFFRSFFLGDTDDDLTSSLLSFLSFNQAEFNTSYVKEIIEKALMKNNFLLRTLMLLYNSLSKPLKDEQTNASLEFYSKLLAAIETLSKNNRISDESSKVQSAVVVKALKSSSISLETITSHFWVKQDFVTLSLLLKEYKHSLTPYIFNIISSNPSQSLLEIYSESCVIKQKKFVLLITKYFNFVDLAEFKADIFKLLLNKNWKIKLIGFKILIQLCKVQISKKKNDEKDILDLEKYVVDIVEIVIDNVNDIKKEVSKISIECLEQVCKFITNPEIKELLNPIKDTIQHMNYTNIDSCLDKVLDKTFVNVLTFKDLALLIPIINRSLAATGNGEIIRKALITLCNLTSLVSNVKDLNKYYQKFKTDIMKLEQHSTPEIRSLATKTLLILKQELEQNNEDNGGVSNNQAEETEEKSVIQKARVERLIENIKEEVEEENIKIDSIIQSYLLDKCCSFIYLKSVKDLNKSSPTSIVKKHIGSKLKLITSPLFKSVTVSTSEDFKNINIILTENILNSWLLTNSRVYRQSSHRRHSLDREQRDSEEEEYLIYVENIILGFASRQLLKRTKLEFLKNRKYGIIGQNGVGKTTLLDRLAEKNILGFPKDIKIFYVRHEILASTDITVFQYLQQSLASEQTKTGDKREEEKLDSVEKQKDRVENCLNKVGFKDDLKHQLVSNLSGGWKMKLAIAESMLLETDLLLMDEPTNHLDVEAIDWLVSYLNNLQTTIILVSHDYDFVSQICTNIVHISNLKLTYFDCNFIEFQKLEPQIVQALPKRTRLGEGNENQANDGGNELDSVFQALSLEITDERYLKALENIKPITFPQGSKLAGLTSRGKTILSLENLTFRYPSESESALNSPVVLNNVSCRLNLNSRVALTGKNGSGKTTLLKLLVGQLDYNPTEEEKESLSVVGKVYKHHNLRTAYIAQHSLHHLEENLEKSPCQYIQKRFYEGRDLELSKMLTLKLTPEEEEKKNERGEICKVISRVKRGKKLYYEVQKTGRTNREGDLISEFRSLDELEVLNKKHALKLCRMFDEKLKAADSGIDLRPVTTVELVKHLKEFGIEESLAKRKIRWLSGGQKCRLVLAAAMWTRPHLIALDEPTNYLDNETLAALTAALRSFRGGVITISHHEAFVNALAKEVWTLEKGMITTKTRKRGS